MSFILRTLALGLILTSQFLSARELTVMSYNLYNLFDTTHDVGKEDYTYLPLAVKQRDPEVQAYCRSLNNEYYQKSCLELDWSEKVLRAKFIQLSRVIRAMNQGRGPDVLIVQEVENLSVLKRLVDEGLRGMNYHYVSLIEGPDERGIDNGIISRFPFYETPQNHLVDLGGRNTRGILEASITVEGKVVTLFGNHWPSQGNPAKDRYQSAQTLMKAASMAPGEIILAIGDFNTIDTDNPHGINQVLLHQNQDLFFFDVYEDVERAQLPTDYWTEGTHWYRGSYVDLDRAFFIIKNESSETPFMNYFRIFSPTWVLEEKEWQDRRTGEVKTHLVPSPFDAVTLEGYSDHLPLIVSIEI